MNGHTHQLILHHTTVSTEQIEEMKSTEGVGITFVIVLMHLIHNLRRGVPHHLIGILQEQIQILDGMIACIPLVNWVVVRLPEVERRSHLLVIVVNVVDDRIVGGHIRHVRRILLVWQHQVGIVHDTTCELRIRVDITDIMIILNSWLEEVVTGCENDGSHTENENILKFHNS